MYTVPLQKFQLLPSNFIVCIFCALLLLQNRIGADIIMALDDVVRTTITGPRIEEAMYRTLRWIDRCIAGNMICYREQNFQTKRLVKLCRCISSNMNHMQLYLRKSFAVLSKFLMFSTVYLAKMNRKTFQYVKTVNENL